MTENMQQNNVETQAELKMAPQGVYDMRITDIFLDKVDMPVWEEVVGEDGKVTNVKKEGETTQGHRVRLVFDFLGDCAGTYKPITYTFDVKQNLVWYTKPADKWVPAASKRVAPLLKAINKGLPNYKVPFEDVELGYLANCVVTAFLKEETYEKDGQTKTVLSITDFSSPKDADAQQYNSNRMVSFFEKAHATNEARRLELGIGTSTWQRVEAV